MRVSFATFLKGIALILCCQLAWLQPSPNTQASPAPANYYSHPKNPHPQSIGKAYMGREIASVMGFGGVHWLERNTREAEEGISQLVEALDLKPGQVVADIGAGSGVIAIPMAAKLQAGGKVIAVDIQKEMLQRLVQNAKKKGIKNIQPVLGSIDNPKLAAGTVDLIIMVDVYHEFSHPYEMMLALSKALKPGGQLALVEYRGEDPKVPIKELHKMTLQQIRKELAPAEFQLEFVRIDSSLPRQHLVFFRKKPGK